jgi:hypothetical protein
MHKYAALTALVLYVGISLWALDRQAAAALDITAAASAPTCETFLARLRNAGRELSLSSLPNPRFEHNQQGDVANSVEQVIYNWPDNTAQIGVLSCAPIEQAAINRGEFVFYRMQADTAAHNQQNGDTPRSQRNLNLISAAIFAYTGKPPTRSEVQLLLAQQPRQPNDIDATLALPGGHRVWLGYDNFAISPWRTLANEASRGVRVSGSEAEGRPTMPAG